MSAGHQGGYLQQIKKNASVQMMVTPQITKKSRQRTKFKDNKVIGI